jgi:hypothetical protein
MSIDVFLGILLGTKDLPTLIVFEANSNIVLVSVPILYKPHKPLVIDLMIRLAITST